MENINLNQIQKLALEYAPKLAAALLLLILGLWVVKIATKGFKGLLNRKKMDPSLAPFLGSLFNTILKVLLVISVMSMVGVEMTSFVAILGAASLAVGMALSGTLQNFAGGVMILTFKPFVSGDVIEAQGYIGKVKEIQIFNTILNTPDNKVVILPNGGLSTSSLINYSKEATRRVDMVFGIGYDDDIKKTKEVLHAIIAADQRILKDPEAFVAIGELADNSVNFTVRVWVKSEDYWGVFFDMHEKVKLTFDEEGISIPYPQRDVHLYTEK